MAYKYSEDLIEEVRSQNDIVDVIGGYVKLQRKGSSYFGLCPFHNEKSPSFSVSPSKQIFYCFGCGQGGNVISFIQKYENYNFIDAFKLLADRAGITLPEVEYSKEEKEKEAKKTRLLEANMEAAKFFYYQLRNPVGKAGMDYFVGRQLSEETMKHFGLGFSPVSSGACVNYLRSKGFSDEIIREAGLANFDEKYGLQDKFWNRVMFPIQDMNHRVIAFGGRVMSDAKPKYLNSSESMIFDKSRNLYGLNFARTSRKDHFILCEGYMDVISMHQAGFTEAVASLGTAFTSGQATILKRFAQKAYLAYDSDGAGTTAALRAIGILRNAGMTGKVINLKPYKDPDEFIKNLGVFEFQKRIDEAENSFFFEIRIMERDFEMDDPDGRTRFIRALSEKLVGFSDEIERENYIRAMADKYKLTYEALKKQVVNAASINGGEYKPIERPKSGIQSKETEDGVKKAQRILLTWLCEEPQVMDIVKEYIGVEDFTDPVYAKVAQLLFEDLRSGKVNPAGYVDSFEEEEQQRICASLFNTRLDEIQSKEDRETALHDIVYKIKKNSIDEFTKNSGGSIEGMMKSLADKKTLEKLANTTFKLNE